jgi:hypothetical protein
MDGFMAEIRKIPPVTRFLCASSLAVTIPVLMNMVSVTKVVFTLDSVMRRFEVCNSYVNTVLMQRRLMLVPSYGGFIPVSSSGVRGLQPTMTISDNELVCFVGGGINYIFEFVML